MESGVANFRSADDCMETAKKKKKKKVRLPRRIEFATLFIDPTTGPELPELPPITVPFSPPPNTTKQRHRFPLSPPSLPYSSPEELDYLVVHILHLLLNPCDVRFLSSEQSHFPSHKLLRASMAFFFNRGRSRQPSEVARSIKEGLNRLRDSQAPAATKVRGLHTSISCPSSLVQNSLGIGR